MLTARTAKYRFDLVARIQKIPGEQRCARGLIITCSTEPVDPAAVRDSQEVSGGFYRDFMTECEGGVMNNSEEILNNEITRANRWRTAKAIISDDPCYNQVGCRCCHDSMAKEALDICHGVKK